MLIWVLREDTIAPIYQMRQIALLDGPNFKTIYLARKYMHNVVQRDTSKYEDAILNQARFNRFYKLQLTNSAGQVGTSSVKLANEGMQYNSKRIKEELERLRCIVDPKSTSFAFSIIAKMASHLTTGIFVDSRGQDKIHKMMSNRKTRVVLMPLFKTYADALIMLYMSYIT